MTDVTQIQTTYWESLQRKKVKSHPKDNCLEKRELERKVTELSAFKGGTFWSQLSDKICHFFSFTWENLLIEAKSLLFGWAPPIVVLMCRGDSLL